MKTESHRIRINTEAFSKADLCKFGKSRYYIDAPENWEQENGMIFLQTYWISSSCDGKDSFLFLRLVFLERIERENDTPPYWPYGYVVMVHSPAC